MTQHLLFQVVDKIAETDRTVTLVLEPAHGSLTYRAGQFLTFLFGDLGATEIRRSYSLSSAPGIDAHPAVTVTKVTNGLVSRYLVDAVRPGDELTALPPAGRFVLDDAGGQPRDIFLIGGGSGITPLYSHLKYVLHREPQSRVVLIDANRDAGRLIFRRALTELAAAFPDQFTAIHYLSSPREELAVLRREMAPARLRWGRLSNALIEELVRRHLHFPAERARFFLCGPPGLLVKTENTLGYLGFAAGQVHREVFTIKTVYRPDAERFPHSQVHLVWGDRSYHFPVLPGQHILEAAQRAGLDLPYSCRSGSCTTCAAQCRAGKVEMYTQDGRQSSEETGGIVLTCVGYPLTPDVQLEM